MINIIVSILFLLFVTSLTLTLFTIIKHTEKILPVLEQFKWPLTAVPLADKLGTLNKYEVEKKIADKLISILDLDNNYNIYFDDEKTKKNFIFDVNNYDFIFYYAKISNNNYYVPSNYIYLNSKTNVKPPGSKYNLGIVLSENKNNNIQTSENLNLFDLITHNIDWKFNNGDQQIINFITPVKSLSYNNFVTGKAIIYNEQQQGNNYTPLYTYFYIDKGDIIHILSKENNNELLKLKLNKKYQLVNVVDINNTYSPSMLLYNIGFDVALVKLLENNPATIPVNDLSILQYAYYGTSHMASVSSKYYKFKQNGNDMDKLASIIFFPNKITKNELDGSAGPGGNNKLSLGKYIKIAETGDYNILYYIDNEMAKNFDPTKIITMENN